MMKIPQSIQNVIDKEKELKHEIRKVGKDAIKDVLNGLFATYPYLLGVRWTQYTPHFNDGDPCVFSVNEPEVCIKEGMLIAKGHPERQWGKEDEFSSGDYHNQYDIRDLKDLLGSLHELKQLFSDIEGAMLSVFGDGNRVTVTRDGSVEIEEYDHD